MSTKVVARYGMSGKGSLLVGMDGDGTLEPWWLIVVARQQGDAPRGKCFRRLVG